MPTITTERLLLRPFTLDDWRDLQKVAVDWKAAPGPAFDKWPTDDEPCRQFAQYLAGHDNYLAVCLRASGQVIGLLAINGVDPAGQADLGHVILARHQDGDLDREALAAMVQHCFALPGVQSIVTRNDPDHTAQLAPLRALGFVCADPDRLGELTLNRPPGRSVSSSR